MAHVDIWSLILLAIGPAILGAAFAARLNRGVHKAAALTIAAAPSVAFAYLALNAWLQGDAEIPVIGIALSGLGLTAFAARFGHRLSRRRGLALLIAMAILPVAVLAFLYVGNQAAKRASQSRVPTFEELVEDARLTRIYDEERLKQAASELPALEQALKQCAQNLSANRGRKAARADHRQGKLQLIILYRKGQEHLWEEIPGIDRSEHEIAQKLPEPPYLRTKYRPVQQEMVISLVRSPYGLWSDPWQRYPFPELRPLIETCDADVRSYATAYNQTMVGLNPQAGMPRTVPDRR